MIFASRYFFQKMNKQIRLYYLSTCFWFFWKKVKKPKRHFDIYWPLPNISYLTRTDIQAGMLESQVSLNFELNRAILNYHICSCFLKAKIIYDRNLLSNKLNYWRKNYSTDETICGNMVQKSEKDEFNLTSNVTF